MYISIDVGAERIIDRLEKAGFASYITGEALRDYLMEHPISCIHISTAALPSQIIELFDNCINITNQSVTVIENKIGYEISTFRTSPLIFSRKPDIYDDLSLFGFTIDAVAFNKREGFLDFFGGVSDIRNKIIKCVVTPDEYFPENPAEMLRAVRLCVTLNFIIEENTEKAIRKYSIYSKQIPRSVVLEEFNKILLSEHPDKGFRLLHELGMLRHMMPELDRCFYVPQKNKYHIYNVGEHILHALINTPADLILRWAALLHDIGKPCCLSHDHNGIIHFYGHHRESMSIADNILTSLRLNPDMIHDIVILIEYHDVRIDASLPSIKRIMSRMGEKQFQALLLLQEADCKAKNPIYISEKIEKLQNLHKLFKTIIEELQPYKISDLAINARDLSKLKYKAGREITDTLRTLLEDVIINPALNNHQYLIKRAKNLKNRGSK